MVSMDNPFELPGIGINTFKSGNGNGHGGCGFKSGEKKSSDNSSPDSDGCSKYSFMGYRITTDGELVK